MIQIIEPIIKIIAAVLIFIFIDFKINSKIRFL